MEIYIDQRIDCKNLGHTEYQIPGQFELQSQVILYGGLSSLNKNYRKKRTANILLLLLS